MIVILKTTDSVRVEQKNHFKVYSNEKTEAYRVCYFENPRDFYYLIEHEPHHLEDFLHEKYGQSQVFYSAPAALAFASHLLLISSADPDDDIDFVDLSRFALI